MSQIESVQQVSGLPCDKCREPAVVKINTSWTVNGSTARRSRTLCERCKRVFFSEHAREERKGRGTAEGRQAMKERGQQIRALAEHRRRQKREAAEQRRQLQRQAAELPLQQETETGPLWNGLAPEFWGRKGIRTSRGVRTGRPRKQRSQTTQLQAIASEHGASPPTAPAGWHDGNGQAPGMPQAGQ